MSRARPALNGPDIDVAVELCSELSGARPTEPRPGYGSGASRCC